MGLPFWRLKSIHFLSFPAPVSDPLPWFMILSLHVQSQCQGDSGFLTSHHLNFLFYSQIPIYLPLILLRTLEIILELPGQFSSVTQLCPTFCDPTNCSTPGLPVHHQLPEFTQTHVHRVSDIIQPSHPLLSPSPPARNPSQPQSLFQ